MAILKSSKAKGGAHAAGIYSDMTLDGPEIGTLVVVIDRAKNLPNRKTMGKQDPYCAMRLGKEAKKTDTDRRGGQTPKWDQELRFTVHDSPDYYKLKCSIFNDDKKTELIGEAWIDLVDVIKLGGGQNDSWQQLNFKGKYAGDIRMELTFYDTREKPQEKRRKERSQSSVTGSSEEIIVPSNRSLGPREIKRRPLPSSPAGLLQVQSTPPQTPATALQLPPKVPFDEQQSTPQVHAPVAVRPRSKSPSPMPYEQPQQSCYDEDSIQGPIDQFEYQPVQHFAHQQHSQQQLQHPQQPWQAPLGHDHLDYQQDFGHRQERVLQGNDSDDYQHSLSLGSSYRDELEIWQQRRPQSVHTHSAPTTPQTLSPAHRPAPLSANSDSQLVRHHQHHRSDAGVSRAVTYADSPLRQSMSHQDIPQPLMQADAPPPLPPKHRDTPPRRPKSEYPPSAYIPQPLRIGVKRSSVSDRSPLQSLEDEFDSPHQGQSHQLVHQQRHSMYDAPAHQPQEMPDYALQLYDRSRSYTEPHMSEPQLPPQAQHRPSQQSRRNSYEIRHPSYGQQVMEEPQSMTPADHYHSEHEDLQPTVEDAPPSPNLQPVIPRKAVGAQPQKLNGLPFGPDAYDVLNPANSPVTNERTPFETHEQAKESQRMREVQKVRDLGPIIGNDGRVIDPSDHLPSDTWAPEPERKNKKPEHVVHIRSKNGFNRPAGARASPVVIRHNGSASAQGTPTCEPASSPASQTRPSSFIGGRNRLQKVMPADTRALPNQPYNSPARTTVSSPALASSPQQVRFEESPQSQRPLQQRRPSHDNHSPSHLTRPPLSEYQVPVGNDYPPRTNSYDSYRQSAKTIEQNYGSTTSKSPKQLYGNDYSSYSAPAPQPDQRASYERRNSDYSFENHPMDDAPAHNPYTQAAQPQRHYDDPLAAEMSLIDIGPSRHNYHQGSTGRSMARRW